MRSPSVKGEPTDKANNAVTMRACRSLPYKISEEDLYEIFGKYGAIRQIRLGSTNATRGTAYVVYEDIFQAKHACEKLNGFQVAGRYLIVSSSHPHFVSVITLA